MSKPVPPLSQSRQALLACPVSYVEQVINGNKEPASEASSRGSTIHRFLSEYVRHLVATKQKKDEEKFDAMLARMEPSAKAILLEMATFEIDPELVFATEFHICLDVDFKAVSHHDEPSYEMTLDLIELLDEHTAEITDYKSQFQAIAADTFQARLYSLGLMMLNPQINEVRFHLRFLRWGTEKTAIFTREHIEELQDEARNYRAFQLALHSGGPAEALPGTHCVYCPLLAAGCPIEKNPYQDPAGHLRNALYFRQALKKSEQIVRTFADKNGPLYIRDANGTEYEAAWRTQVRKKFSIEALPTLMAWQKKMNDLILPKLSLSGLSNLLKAKKRQDLADECTGYCEAETVARFHIGKVGDENGQDED